MRIRESLGRTITIPASSVVTITGQEIPTDGLVGITIGTSGVGGQIAAADLSAFRLKANGTPIVDLSAIELRSLIESYLPGKPAIANADAAPELVIPLNLFNVHGPDRESLADICQFPRGASAVLEITCSDGVGGGLINVGFIRNPFVEPKLQPRLIGSAAGVTAGAQTRATVQNVFTQEGFILRDIALPQTNLTETLIDVGGVSIVLSSGSGTAGTRNLSLASQLLDGGGLISSENLEAMWYRLNLNQPFPLGRGRILATTAAGWAGTERVATWQTGPQ